MILNDQPDSKKVMEVVSSPAMTHNKYVTYIT